MGLLGLRAGLESCGLLVVVVVVVVIAVEIRGLGEGRGCTVCNLK